MRMKLLTALALSTALMAGPAMAQTTSATSKNASGPNFMSQEEQMMYEDNADFAGFFTDETLSELRSDEDIGVAYNELSEDRQDVLQRNCKKTFENRASYGAASLALCSKLQAM